MGLLAIESHGQAGAPIPPSGGLPPKGEENVINCVNKTSPPLLGGGGPRSGGGGEAAEISPSWPPLPPIFGELPTNGKEERSALSVVSIEIVNVIVIDPAHGSQGGKDPGVMLQLVPKAFQPGLVR